MSPLYKGQELIGSCKCQQKIQVPRRGIGHKLMCTLARTSGFLLYLDRDKGKHYKVLGYTEYRAGLGTLSTVPELMSAYRNPGKSSMASGTR